jgi:hypothetical protein
VAARRGDFEGALGALLTLDVSEIGQRSRRLAHRWTRRRHHLRPLEMIDELDQGDGGEHVKIPGRPGGLRSAFAWADQPVPRALAAIAAGKTPATAVIVPSSASSPRTV